MLSITKQFRPKQAVEVAIVSPLDGTTPTGLTLTLCGRYTAAYDAAQAEAAKVAEQGQEAVVRALVTHSVIGWTGAVDDEGQEVPVSAAAVAETFAAAPWLYEQVLKAFLDTTRFFEPAKTS